MEKGNDWFFALAIIIAALVVVAIIFDNVLFALLIGIAGGVLGVAAAKRPNIVPYEVSVRGVRIEDQLHSYSALVSYYIDEDNPRGPQLLLKPKQKLAPLLILPLPVEQIDPIEDILAERLEEEELHEPLLMKILELFGF